MKQNLLKTLDEKKIFKLVLGLGNRDFCEIENLVMIYASVGADMFDINPSREAVEAVMRGIANAKQDTQNFYYSISTGISGDTHIQKCSINIEKCKRCGKCVKKCPREAIFWDGKYPNVVKEKCIGCRKCDDCKAISFTETQNDIEEIVSIANEFKLDCVELHLSSKKIPDKEIKYIIKNFGGVLSLCLDRTFYSNERLKKLIKKVTKWNNGTDFIIQADGVPMSGGDNTFNSTLQAVATAHLIQDYGTYILMSGGTNAKTAELAKICGLRYNGVSVGSYARKIISNKEKNDALILAKELVEACKQ